MPEAQDRAVAVDLVVVDRTDDSPIVILPREVVLTACRAMAEAATALEAAGESWDLPVGLVARLEGHAASLDWAGIQLAEQFIEERTARRLHPSNSRHRPAAD